MKTREKKQYLHEVRFLLYLQGHIVIDNHNPNQFDSNYRRLFKNDHDWQLTAHYKQITT